jgi:hypothetical protein
VRLLNMKPRGPQPFGIQQATVAVVLDEQYDRAIFGGLQSSFPGNSIQPRLQAGTACQGGAAGATPGARRRP